MQLAPNAARIILAAALLAGPTALLAACDTAGLLNGSGASADRAPQPVPTGAEATMAQPSPISPSAPVSPRVATPGIFSPGPTSGGD